MEPSPTIGTMQTPEDASTSYEYISPIGELLSSFFVAFPTNPVNLTPRALSPPPSWLAMQPLFIILPLGLVFAVHNVGLPRCTRSH